MINWGVRFKNRTWVLAFVSQIMIVAQMLLHGMNVMGWTSFQLTDQIQSEVLLLVNGVFVILSMLGVVQDPTTKGYQDSKRAMAYRTPN